MTSFVQYVMALVACNGDCKEAAKLLGVKIDDTEHNLRAEDIIRSLHPDTVIGREK